MTDADDVQRARRYITRYGISRSRFRSRFPSQFVANQETHLYGPEQGVASGEADTIFIKIKGQYYIYNTRRHRIVRKVRQ